MNGKVGFQLQGPGTGLRVGTTLPAWADVMVETHEVWVLNTSERPHWPAGKGVSQTSGGHWL